MPNTAIVNVDVNDEQFKKFLELYDGFHAKLAEVPEDWAKVDKASSAAFNAIGAAMLAQNALLAQGLKGQRDLNEESGKAATSWEKLSRHTKDAAGHIMGAAKALAKWVEISSIVSGLLGVGSLFGLDRLGLAVTAGRRSSAGLGVSYGQQQSFGLNFGRFVDPGAVLGSVSTGIFDVTSPEYLALLKAGVSPQMLAKGNAADIGAELLAKIPQTFGKVPANQRGLMANVLGYSQLGIGAEEINRYLNASPEERAQQQKAYRADAQGLDLTKPQQSAWNNLTTQLTRAGKMIETTFVVGLTGLTGPIARLSEGFAAAVKAFASSETVRHWMDLLGDGLKQLGDWIAGPNFKSDVEDFAKHLGELVSAIAAAAKFIASLFSSDAPAGPKDDQPLSLTHPFRFGPAKPLFGSSVQKESYSPPDLGSAANGNMPALGSTANGNVPSGLLNRISYQESRGNPLAVSPKGAMGEFQFMPDTWKEYGAGGDPFNPQDSRAAAGRFMAHLLAKFAGNLREATAAYNWGEGNVDKDLKKHGADWESYLPAETKDYLAKVLGGNTQSARAQAPNPRPSITVHNNTGGSAVISAAQIAV